MTNQERTLQPRTSAGDVPDDALDALLRDAFSSVAAPSDVVEATKASLAESAPRARKPLAKIYRIRIAATLAACFILTAVGVGGATAWGSVVSVVEVQVNPSVELSLNCFDAVIAAQGTNDDGRLLLEECDVIGMPYERALDALLGSDMMARIALSQEGRPLEVNVAISCDSDERQQQLCDRSEQCVNAAGAGQYRLRLGWGAANAEQGEASAQGEDAPDQCEGGEGSAGAGNGNGAHGAGNGSGNGSGNGASNGYHGGRD